MRISIAVAFQGAFQFVDRSNVTERPASVEKISRRCRGFFDGVSEPRAQARGIAKRLARHCRSAHNRLESLSAACDDNLTSLLETEFS